MNRFGLGEEPEVDHSDNEETRNESWVEEASDAGFDTDDGAV